MIHLPSGRICRGCLRCIAMLAMLVGVVIAAAQNGVHADDDPKDDGFVSLFNGKDLSGWRGDDSFWTVRDGVLVGETTPANPASHNTFLIRDGETYGDFELRFEYQVNGFNSGVQYRSVENDDFVVSGYQADFEARWHDEGTKDKFSGMFFEENGRMFLAKRGQAVIVRESSKPDQKADIEVIGSTGDAAELESAIKRDDWNQYTVIAKGFQFTHIINGKVMSVAIDQDPKQRRSKGIIAFQLHSGPPMKIQLRNVRIRKLD